MHIIHSKVNTAGDVRLQWRPPKGTVIILMRARNDTTRDEWVGVGLAKPNDLGNIRYLASGIPSHEAELSYLGPEFEIEEPWSVVSAKLLDCGANDDLALIVGYR